ncbi:XRE family transcriptional regulator [Neobacillus sp. PS3-40]|uniref:helix-turn-helix domain-containing protein n=1 Tax=Neobacillus sp. PS3-40 TaxID=3070679 RepID=UPI0027DEEDEE|nr:XRE family transcriptional regulator [Neobacillus sp. PS3-40]WML44683.1 XRE family transcriptional regulator [Neobacillus sp. PS3-40]
MNIGIEIKKLRTEKGITLKELSEKSELSIGFLSQLERGLTTIAVDSLEKLADILEVHLTHFFDYPHKRKDKVLRSYEHEILDLVEAGFIKYSLSPNLENKHLVPRLIEILPQKKDEEILSYKHEGEEFIYVLEGILTVYINGERHEVYPGDSVHMESNIEHNWANYTNKKVKLLAVNTPNYIYNRKYYSADAE